MLNIPSYSAGAKPWRVPRGLPSSLRAPHQASGSPCLKMDGGSLSRRGFDHGVACLPAMHRVRRFHVRGRGPPDRPALAPRSPRACSSSSCRGPRSIPPPGSPNALPLGAAARHQRRPPRSHLPPGAETPPLLLQQRTPRAAGFARGLWHGPLGGTHARPAPPLAPALTTGRH